MILVVVGGVDSQAVLCEEWFEAASVSFVRATGTHCG